MWTFLCDWSLRHGKRSLVKASGHLFSSLSPLIIISPKLSWTFLTNLLSVICISLYHPDKLTFMHLPKNSFTSYIYLTFIITSN